MAPKQTVRAALTDPDAVSMPGNAGIGWRHRLTESYVLIPLVGVLSLIALWSTTFGLVAAERRNAHDAAELAVAKQVETYAAYMVRALREIDQTLKWIASLHEVRGNVSLSSLDARGLLPPGFLFTIALTDASGRVVASTDQSLAIDSSMPDHAVKQRGNSELRIATIGRTGAAPNRIRFSRELRNKQGRFDGLVHLSVDAPYFVASYDSAQMGDRGLLSLARADGEILVRRTGSKVISGGPLRVAPAVAGVEAGSVRRIEGPLDGIPRYVSRQVIFGFPLMVTVGLALDEQLASGEARIETYLWRTAGASIAIVLLVFVIARISFLLAQSRLRAGKAQFDHARRIEYLAYHDGLTGLPNRSFLSKLLGQEIKQAKRNGSQVAIVFLDLDRFKQVNDTLGHDAGDDLLQQVARRLRGCVRERDTVARLGGDEFVVLLSDLDNSHDAANVARKIVAEITRPLYLREQELLITTSIGISLYPSDGMDEQTLMKGADVAMYYAKEKGKNNFQFYSSELNQNSLERLALASSLHKALERDEFRLYFQAKREIETGRITGAEALLRWEHPHLGMLSPMRFIPLAEENGLIIPIGHWVLRTACVQSVAWARQGFADLSIAVNLSPRQFHDDRLVDDIRGIVADTGADPSLLELEVTESLLMHDVTKAIQTLTELKAIGIRIAIDDFGTGYSSLSSLKQFPLDTIKIDRSFIRDITGDTPCDDSTLAEAIIAMGRALSLTVVAEGVETPEQEQFLREHACDQFQGFYLNKPAPTETFTDFLSMHSARKQRW